MNSSNSSILDIGGGKEQGGGGGCFLDGMEQRCYPRASSLPRDLVFIPDGRREEREMPMSNIYSHLKPDERVKHHERERLTGYHLSPHCSTSPAAAGVDRDNLIKYRDRECTMLDGGGGCPRHSYVSRHQRYSSHGNSWDDAPVQDMHDNGEGGRYNDPYGDTRGYHPHNNNNNQQQNNHQNRSDDREDAIRKKESTYNAGRAVHEKMIEVVPGFQMRLRGAEETWAAVERDFFGPATCFSCEMTIFCILDAEYVLCPTCKVVFPFEQDGGEGGKSKNCAKGGVGLGFSMEDLARFQSDIVSRYS